MSGAASRGKGHRWDRTLAHWFSDRGFGDIRSGRSVTGGTQMGADLVTLTDDGHPIWNVAGWMKQAADDANGKPFAIIHKNRRRPTHQAQVYIPAVHAEQLLDLDLPADVRHVTVDLHVFTAALARWDVTDVAA